MNAPEGSGTRRRGNAVRAATGVIGELLITAGVLVGLFVVWQAWWTDVAVSATQAELVDELEGDPPPNDTPSEAQPTSAPPEPDPTRQSPPVLAPPESEGVTFASLRVPRWGDDYVRPVSEGVSRQRVLDVMGIGHYPGTAMPGDTGNFAVAGHRVGFGRPFYRIDELQVGDPLVVRTADTWYVYKVTSSAIVPPTDVAVIAPVPGAPEQAPDQATITLTTCHPVFSTRERFIVHGVLDSWMPADDGVPDLLRGSTDDSIERTA